MSSAITTAQAPDRGAFLRARLASALAVVPLGVWTFFHLLNNLAAFNGSLAWQSAVTEHESPGAQLITGIVVLVPLGLHTVWGIGRLFTTQPNNTHYGMYGNLKYLLQRVSAVGVLLFLGAHLWLALIHPRLTTGHGELFSDISHEMRFNPPTLIVYVLGTLGVAYHLANGLQTVAMGWGLVSSRQALRRLEGTILGLFVLLLVMSWAAIYALWRVGV